MSNTPFQFLQSYMNDYCGNWFQNVSSVISFARKIKNAKYFGQLTEKIQHLGITIITIEGAINIMELSRML